jgi:hypothetical protein
LEIFGRRARCSGGVIRHRHPKIYTIRDIGDGYADTSSHGRVCFVISLNSNDGAMRFRLLKAIEARL